VPQAVIDASQSARANLTKLRQEINLFAQVLDKRNLNITNHAERTDELCRETQAKCNETITRFDALLKNIGAQVDIKAIIEGIRKTLENVNSLVADAAAKSRNGMGSRPDGGFFRLLALYPPAKFKAPPVPTYAAATVQ